MGWFDDILGGVGDLFDEGGSFLTGLVSGGASEGIPGLQGGIPLVDGKIPAGFDWSKLPWGDILTAGVTGAVGLGGILSQPNPRIDPLSAEGLAAQEQLLNFRNELQLKLEEIAAGNLKKKLKVQKRGQNLNALGNQAQSLLQAVRGTTQGYQAPLL